MDTPSPTAPRVLLVDDDAIQRRLMEHHLRAEGLEVISVPSADRAMAIVYASAPDLVLSDVVMGEIDGFRLCQMLRQYPPTAKVPVILASAHCDEVRDGQLARAVGATTIVQRTPDQHAELAAVRYALSSHAPVPTRVDSSTADALHEGWIGSQLVRLSNDAQTSERWYRTVFENTHDAIAIVSDDGIVLEVNPRSEELMGRPAAEIVGRHISDFAAPGHRDTNLAYFERTLGGAAETLPVLSIARRDGKIIQLAVSTTRIEIDGRVRVYSIGRDVTDELAAQQHLTASEQRYRSLLANIPDAIWTADPDGRMTFMTPNIVAIYGLTAEQVLAMPIEARLERIHPEDRLRLGATYRASLSSDHADFDVEYRFRHASGDWVWVHNRGRLVEADGARHFEGVISDITKRKALEEQATQLQKLEAIGQLTAGVAHDFNNILASILSNAQFLMESLSPQDPRHADAEEIRFAADRAAALTRQLLAFSRKQVLTPEPVDLRCVTGGLEKMLRRLIGEDIELVLPPGAAVRPVRADVGQIEQVVMNLCVNARDAMPRGGRIEIAVDDVVVGEAEAQGTDGVPEGSYVRLSVTDTGCGMDAATLKRCFEPFFTTKGVGKGTGLGLSTTYGIVRQSDGHIRVTSTPGAGTTFRIYFPPTEQAPIESRVKAKVAPAHGTETILLVEDDDLVRNAVRRLLQSRGYKVLPAREGAEALAVAASHPAIDLVVTDLVMPGSSGPEVIAALRNVLPTFRVLFMSGYAEHPMFDEGGIEPGVNFVQKPFTNDELAARIRELLDGTA